VKYPIPYSSRPAESLGVSGGTKKAVGTLGLWGGSAINPKHPFSSPSAHSSSSQQSQLILCAGRCLLAPLQGSTAEGCARCCCGRGWRRGEQTEPKGLGSGSSDSVTSAVRPAGLKRGFAASLRELQKTAFPIFLCCAVLHVVLNLRKCRLPPASQLLNRHKLQWCHRCR